MQYYLTFRLFTWMLKRWPDPNMRPWWVIAFLHPYHKDTLQSWLEKDRNDLNIHYLIVIAALSFIGFVCWMLGFD
jgi:hypothetical protein